MEIGVHALQVEVGGCWAGVLASKGSAAHGPRLGDAASRVSVSGHVVRLGSWARPGMASMNEIVAPHFHGRRLRYLRLSRTHLLRPVPMGGILWLDLETVERRHLLASSSDASIHVYDTFAGPEQDGLGEAQPSGPGHAPGIPPVLSISKSSPGGHQFSVSCATWYPQDTGIFVTGACEGGQTESCMTGTVV